MKKFIKNSLASCISFSFLLGSANAQQTTNQALEKCMNETMAQSAAVGALVGGLFGALVGDKGNKNAAAAVGAGLGGLAGGAIGWQNSWKSCTESLNIVTVKNVQTEDYRKTAERLAYNGQDVIFKVEGIGVSPQVVAGGNLNSSFKAVLLKPDPSETSQVQVTRSWTCGNSSINIKPEIFTAAQGTIIQEGKVQIPSAKPEVGVQQCEMLIQVEAEGKSQQFKRPFTIQPN